MCSVKESDKKVVLGKLRKGCTGIGGEWCAEKDTKNVNKYV
jgi:hypothetical protein